MKSGHSYGMINQLSKFTDHLADKAKPLRDLLSKNNSWSWGYAQEKAFKEIKKCLISYLVLTLYDCNRGIKVSCHASAFELGRVILQQQDDESWKSVAYFSRALPVEALYSPIEKECLGFA